MIIIEKWAGLVTNASPYALPPGAAVTQVNVQVINPGQLVVRNGHASVSWATVSSATTAAPIRSAFRCPRGKTERVIYQDSLGVIALAQGPS